MLLLGSTQKILINPCYWILFLQMLPINIPQLFCNDVSDPCAVACVRNVKLPKLKPW